MTKPDRQFEFMKQAIFNGLAALLLNTTALAQTNLWSHQDLTDGGAGKGGLSLASLRNPIWVSKDNLRDPSVVKRPDGYRLFYSRFSAPTSGWGDPNQWHIAEVFTKDFVTFTNERDVSPPGCASPGDVVQWHGRWLLPYQTYPGHPTQLVFAESTNLETWSSPKPFLTVEPIASRD